ncbi:MAG TPA: heavy metal-associated domain-containing protein [Crocinitomicaceae bacterium]|nr:heavy metal-associated domain-containing protein [Crocinitomicaceae bacterium]
MKKVLLFSGLVVFLMSCSNNKTENTANNDVAQEQTLDDHKNVKPTTVLTAEIAGMSCEKGCGSSIRKELYGIGGVSKVEYTDFDEEKEYNAIKVYYDENTTSEDDIILALTTMENHKYTLENPQSTPLK